jgi:hypothetical protein
MLSSDDLVITPIVVTGDRVATWPEGDLSRWASSVPRSSAMCRAEKGADAESHVHVWASAYDLE